MNRGRTAQLVRTAFGVGIIVALGWTPAAAQQRDAGDTVKDAWITTQVQAKYFMSPDIKGRNIDVDTANGVVTLSGHVQSAQERQQALAKAREVSGVTNVVDKLTIVPEGKSVGTTGEWPRARDKAGAAVDRLGTEISDTWITTKIQSKYFLDADVKGLSIDVTTNTGVVTLAGQVNSAAERQKAISLAKTTDGVKDVVDKLAVK